MFRIACFLCSIVISALTVSTWVEADEPARFLPNPDKVFFESQIGSSLKELADYAKTPDKKVALITTEYWPIVEGCDRGLRSELRGEIVPDLQFLGDNLVFVPAKHNESKKDIAHLSFRIQKRMFKLAMTSGENGGNWLFISDPEWKKPQTVADAEQIWQEIVDRYLEEEMSQLVPQIIFEEVFSDGEEPIFTGGVTLEPSKRSKIFKQTIQCFIRDSEACLVITTEYRLLPQTGHRPADKWFLDGEGKLEIEEESQEPISGEPNLFPSEANPFPHKAKPASIDDLFSPPKGPNKPVPPDRPQGPFPPAKPGKLKSVPGKAKVS